LLPLLILGAGISAHWWWRRGEVVAKAEFDPGIAPFTIEVRRVPVPVTNSKHFIISLNRGQYVVTSFRYFWPGYTPEHVRISWPCMNQFTVTFDDKYEARCVWSWGAGASWSMTVPEGGPKPGLSPYFFTPRKPPPPGCPNTSLEWFNRLTSRRRSGAVGRWSVTNASRSLSKGLTSTWPTPASLYR